MLQHKHLIVRSEVNNPPTKEDQIVGWAKQLIESMWGEGGTVWKYCNGTMRILPA